MELRTYTEFKRKLAKISTAATTTTKETATVANDGMIMEKKKKKGNPTTSIGKNDHNSSSGGQTPEMSVPDDVTPLLSSPLASSSSPKNIPFVANDWWKKDNYGQARELMTSLTSAAIVTEPLTTSLEAIETRAADEEGRGNVFDPTEPSSNMMSMPSSSSSSVTETTTNTEKRKEEASSWLQLLGEVAEATKEAGGEEDRRQRYKPPQGDTSVVARQQEQRMLARHHTIATIARTRTTGFPATASYNPPPPVLDPLILSFEKSYQQQHLNRPFSWPQIVPSSSSSLSNYQQQQQPAARQHIRPLQQHVSSPLLGLFPGSVSCIGVGGIGSYYNEQQQRQQPDIDNITYNVDTVQSSSSGDIIERELEESFQQDGSFDDDDENGSEGNNFKESEKRNVSNNGDDKNKSKDRRGNIVIDDEDLVMFPDIEPVTPVVTKSGSPFDDVNASVGVNADAVSPSTVAGIIGSNGNGSNNAISSGKQQHPTHNHNKVKKNKINNYIKVKFRAYQAENWTDKFKELLKFREEKGHCLVPNCHPENPSLAQWTKRQRYQYKLRMGGKRSTLTNERVQALDEAGFVWDSHKAVWSERYEELKHFRKVHGHCNVPSRYQANHQLAIWVKRQRRQWKNKMDFRKNCMTDERQESLDSIGFIWDMTMNKKKNKL